MIVWIASYPRSGNTLLRVMLKEVFGLTSLSKYGWPPVPVSPNPRFTELVGHAPLPGPWPEVIESLRQDRRLHLIKTHDLPEGPDPCLYVVRDPAAAIVSYWHFLHDIHQADTSLADVVLGLAEYGTWADHVRGWDPLGRPDTALLHYETLTADPDRAIRLIASVLGREPSGAWDGDIARFQALHPRFFRRGSNQANRDEMPALLQQVVEALSEEAMGRLGYPLDPAGAADRQLLRSLLVGLRDDLCRCRAVAEERLAVIERLDEARQRRRFRIGRLAARPWLRRWFRRGAP